MSPSNLQNDSWSRCQPFSKSKRMTEHFSMRFAESMTRHFYNMKTFRPIESGRYKGKKPECLDIKGESRKTTELAYIISERYSPCSIPISKLKSIDIKGLTLETHHVGRKLTGRISREIPVHHGMGSTITTVIEDSDNTSVTLEIHNPLTNIEAQNFLPKDTIVTLKQPFFENQPTEDGRTRGVIRVDHPSDLHVVSVAIDLDIQSPRLWSRQGLVAFEKQQFSRAIACFDKAIESCEESDLDFHFEHELYLRRAAAHLKMDQYELAFNDVCRAQYYHERAFMADQDPAIDKRTLLNTDIVPAGPSTTSAKIQALKAHSYYGLGQYRLCKDLCSTALSQTHAEDLKATKEELKSLRRCSASRIVESEAGVYDWKAIDAATEQDGGCQHDVASFHRRVSLKDAGPMGRGLFARTSIKKDKEVLVDKAIGYARGGLVLKGDTSNVQFTFDLSLDHPLTEWGEYLHRIIMTNLRKRGPELRAKFFEMHGPWDSRPQFPTLSNQMIVDGQPVIDCFAVLDIARVNCIISTVERSGEDNHGTWVQASFINHSCEPNCKFTFKGDLCILKANRDIKAGEQITVDYFPPAQTQADKWLALKDSWNFECKCPRCVRELGVEESAQ